MTRRAPRARPVRHLRVPVEAPRARPVNRSRRRRGRWRGCRRRWQRCRAAGGHVAMGGAGGASTGRDDVGCGCQTSGAARASDLFAVVLLVLLRRRARRPSSLCPSRQLPGLRANSTLRASHPSKKQVSPCLQPRRPDGTVIASMVEPPFGAIAGRWNEILDRVTDGVIVFDRQWRYVYVNRAAEQYVGMPRERLLGKTIADISPNTWAQTPSGPTGGWQPGRRRSKSRPSPCSRRPG